MGNSNDILEEEFLFSNNTQFSMDLIYGLTPSLAHDLYMEFGKPESIKEVLRYYTNYGEICGSDSRYINMNIHSFAATDKLMRCIIFELPECEDVMDHAYVAIAFDFHHPYVFTCERMDTGEFALCRYEDNTCDDMAYIAYDEPTHIICEVVSEKCDVNYMWNFVNDKIHRIATPGVYLSIAYNTEKKRCVFVNFDTNDPRSSVSLIGTDETELSDFEYNGVQYKIFKNPQNYNFVAFRNAEGGLDHVRVEDWDNIQEYIRINKKNN